MIMSLLTSSVPMCAWLTRAMPGYSRIPVVDKHPRDMVGLLFVKDLVMLDAKESISIAQVVNFFGRKVQKVRRASEIF